MFEQPKLFPLIDKKTGHYPGAKNIPFAANLLDSSTATFKKPDDLKAGIFVFFSDVNADK